MGLERGRKWEESKNAKEYKALIEDVNKKEKDKENELEYRDWSNRVEDAINDVERSIDRTANLFSSKTKREEYKQKKQEYFKKEVEKIKENLRKETELDIELVIDDILDGYEQGDDVEKMEEELFLNEKMDGNMARHVMDGIEKLSEKKEGERIIKKAVSYLMNEKPPGYSRILRRIDHLTKYEWAKPMILKCFKVDPENAIGYVTHNDRIEKKQKEKFLKVIVETMLKQDPKTIIYFENRFKEYKWKDEYLLKAVDKILGLSEKNDQQTIKKKISETNPQELSAILSTAETLEKSGGEKRTILKETLEELLKKDKTEILSMAKRLKGIDYAEEYVHKVVKGLVAEAKDYLLPQYLKQIEDYPFFKEADFKHILKNMAYSDPEYIIPYHYNLMNSEYGKKMIIKNLDYYALSSIMKFKKHYSLLIHYYPDDKEILALWKKHEEELKLADEALKLPTMTISVDQFPIDEGKFKTYIRAMNSASAVWTQRSEHYERGFKLVSTTCLEFNLVFFSESFQNLLKKQAGKITWMNAISLAQVTFRAIEKNKMDITDENINKNVKEIGEKIFKKFEQSRNVELFGAKTNLILFTHQESRFDNGNIVEKIFEGAGGKKEKLLSNEKGVKMEEKQIITEKITKWHEDHGGGINTKYLNKLLGSKDKNNTTKILTLYSIANAKGPTTVLFSGHGSPENLGLDENTADNLNRGLKKNDIAINFKELGDALIENGKIEDLNIIISACYSYNYILNLYGYLEKKGVKKKPRVGISCANNFRPGWSGGKEIDSFFLEAILNESKKGDPIKVDNVYKAEGRLFEKEDPAVFIETDGPEHYLEIAEKEKQKQTKGKV
jgi:hypothetical protein